MSESTRTRRRAETRGRLVRAAVEVFAEQGITPSTVEQICERAGFTRGAFYSNFDSKNAVCLEILADEACFYTDALRRGSDQALGHFGANPDDLRLAPYEVAEYVVDLILRPFVAIADDRRAASPDRLGLLYGELGLYAAREPQVRAAYHDYAAGLVTALEQVLVPLLALTRLRFRAEPQQACEMILSLYEAATRGALLSGAEDVVATVSPQVAFAFRLVTEPLPPLPPLPPYLAPPHPAPAAPPHPARAGSGMTEPGGLSRRRTDTQERLAAAALRLFAERGIGASSVEEICQLAGFTRGAFYSNFDSKADLVRHLLAGQRDQVRTGIARAMAGLDAPLLDAPLLDGPLPDDPRPDDPLRGGPGDRALPHRQALDRAVRAALVAFHADSCAPGWTVTGLVSLELSLYAMREPAIRAAYLEHHAAAQTQLGELVVEVLTRCGLRLTASPQEAATTLLAVFHSAARWALATGEGEVGDIVASRFAVALRCLSEPAGSS